MKTFLKISRALVAKKQKLFTLLLVVAASVGTTFAVTIDGICYYLNDRELTAEVGVNDYSGSIVIPESVTYRAKNYSVTSIEDYAFFGCSGLTSVTIPNSVTSIGSWAFTGCTGLTSVTIGNSVTSIGDGAFYGCSGLTSVTIPSSVTIIGSDAFNDCSGLLSIFVENGNTVYDSRNNCNAIIETATNVLIGGCQNTIIPNGVTSIGDGAFFGCSGLTSVTIPSSITSIGSWAFAGCTGLTSITWKATLCSDFSSSNTPFFCYRSGDEDDSNYDIRTQITSFVFGDEVEHIPAYLCAGMSQLDTVIIPNSVTYIGDGAFRYCRGLTSVTIPNSVTSIGDSAFYYCFGLASVTIPNSVTSIGNYAFHYCSDLTSVTIGNSVTSIGDDAFSYCWDLTSVTLGNSVTSIGVNAFYNCTGLTSVTSLATTPPACPYYHFFDMAFAGVDCSNIPLYVPIESVSLYQAANIWKEFNVIGVMFADEVETAVFSATPTDDYGVILEWQAVENATLYNIEIKQGNNTIRQLQFDSNGKLLNNPSNAPSRYANIRYSSTAVYTGNGWRCEVNDLDPGTNYTYSITVKAENGSVLYTQSIGFITKEETFIIKFVNWNGEELLVLPEVVKGTTPSYTGETPVRPNTAEYTYTFAGWTPAIVAATSDTTYTATYTATKNSYTITWQNEDGSLIDQTTVEYGVVPTHAEPTIQATTEYTYTFAGWTPAVVAVTGDATYKATFTATKNSYTITWQNEDGSLIDQTTVEYGVVPTHADPVKQATAEYTYTFSGWTPDVVAVTSDATYKATFSSVVNVYTISVSAVNGQVIGGGEYQYGATIDLTAIPNEGYVFDQWSDGVKDNPRTITVTGDAEYTALFTSTEGFENIYTSEPVQKVIIDQKVYILRGDKTYTLQGQEVK